MCFQLRPENYDGANVKIAKKDIVCYKRVRITEKNGKLVFSSSVMGLNYKLGVEVKASFAFKYG
jgi:hypothetical protein